MNESNGKQRDSNLTPPLDRAVNHGSAPEAMAEESRQSVSLAKREQLLNKLLNSQMHLWRTEEPVLTEQLAVAFERQVGATCSTEELLALICNEVYIRESLNQLPTLAEYQNRFPQLAEELQIQWDIDRLMSIQQNQTDRDSTLAQTSIAGHATLGLEEFAAGASKPWFKSIGRYEICGEVGRGAMSVVFEAFDPLLKRTVAVKRLRSGFDAGSDELARMRAEAEAVAKLQHANIVQIFDVGEFQGLPFLAMEFCRGGSLAKRLQSQPMLPKLAAELMRRVASGVATAHNCRVIHRDLKPSNVLLERMDDWSPKVADFGLAKLLDGDSDATTTGSIIGTPAYMAPEQAFGDAKRVGPAADIYSLGAILYECLTGRPPFRGATIAETLDQVRSREPLAVRQLEPRVPMDLETITHKCLRKDSLQRYGSAEELIDDLTRFLEMKPIHARRERWHESAWRLAKRYPLAASLATASLLLLLTLAIGSSVFASYLYEAREETSKEKIAAQLGQAEALVGRAHGIRLSRRPGQRFDALKAIRESVRIGREIGQPDEWFEPIRDEAIAALTLPDLYVNDFRDEKRQVQHADFSDDHHLYAFSFDRGDTSIRQMSDHKEVATLPKIEGKTALLFIGNSRLLQFGYPDGDYELLDVGASPPKRIWRNKSDNTSHVVSQQGNQLAVTDGQWLKVISIDQGETLGQMELKPFGPTASVAFHPSHPYLVIHDYMVPSFELRNWQSGECILNYRPTDLEDYGLTGAAWSPDGRRLVLLSGHSRAMRWFKFDPETRIMQLERTLSPVDGNFSSGATMRFAAAGDLLIIQDWNDTIIIFDAITAKTIFNSGPVGKTFGARAPRVDPNNSIAGFFKSRDDPNKIGAMSLAGGRELKLLVPEASQTIGFFVAPTGNFVVAVQKDKIKFADIDSRRVLSEKIFEGGLSCHSVSFDGKNNLYFSTLMGSFRWPYQFLDDEQSDLQFDVPERIHLNGGTGSIATNAKGQTLAVSCWNGMGTQEYAGCWVKLDREPAARKVLGFSYGVACSVSPDSQRVALSFDTNANSCL